MDAAPVLKPSVEEYLRQDRLADRSSEYYDGEIIPLESSSPNHAKISANLTVALGVRMRGIPCELFAQGLRIGATSSHYVYPDLTVVCGLRQYTDELEETVTNPRIVFEVLSPATEDRDHGFKFRLAQRLPSLQEYVLVSQFAPEVELRRKMPDGTWVISSIFTYNKEAPRESAN